jgi:hypothetical protein
MKLRAGTFDFARYSTRMVLTAYSALLGDEFVLSPSSADQRHVRTRLGRRTSADLAPATGARTTRLHRTRLCLRQEASPAVHAAEALMKTEAAPFVCAPVGPPASLPSLPLSDKSTGAVITARFRPVIG